ncbi:MAG TPA: choice-of-anchor D domain-containing protein [Kofleriaceae bacterium]|nr:choice-of-anchor D domain-containing protein [Kofleriaceae bacterium]
MRRHSISLFLSLGLAAACGSVHAVDDAADDDAEVDAGGDGLDEVDGGGVFPLEVAGGPLGFGGVAVGQRSVAISLSVRNRSASAAVPLTAETIGAVDEFELGDSCAGVALAPGEICRIVVTFRPLAAGTRAATLVIGAAGHDEAAMVLLAGRGLTGALSITPPLEDFGAIDLGAQSAPVSFSVDNTGQAVSGAVGLAVTDAAAFRVIDDTCTGTTLGVGGRCAFRIQFVPAVLGVTLGSIEVDGGVAGTSAASVAGRGQAIVSVSRAGAGAGAIRSTPTGIDCGASCIARFETAPVTLIAEAAAGHAFMRWGGACSGTTCSVPLSMPSTSVSATFEPLQSLTVAPSAGGVQIEPLAAYCDVTSCAYAVPRTTSVQLRATPPEGHVFNRWFGVAGCAGHNATCTFTISGDVTVTAAFCPDDDVCCLSPGLPGCL